MKRDVANLSGGSEFKRGIIAATPVIIAILPFGLVLGAQARTVGLSLLEVPLMTGLNFAGGSEFAALELWTSPPNILLIVAITLLVNSRHILMGAVLAPFLAHMPKRKALPALFFMCDESWAIGLADAQKSKNAQEMRFSLPYYLGASCGVYLIWVGSTTLGALIGPLLGDPRTFGFDMAFPAVFLVLLKGMWKGARFALPWFIGLAAAVLAYLYIPGAWYVPAGAITGVLAAFVFSEER